MLKCELCGSSEKVFAHLHYEEHYKYPRFMIVCKRCHARIHRRIYRKQNKVAKKVTIKLDAEIIEELRKRYPEMRDVSNAALVSTILRRLLMYSSYDKNSGIKFDFEE